MPPNKKPPQSFDGADLVFGINRVLRLGAATAIDGQDRFLRLSIRASITGGVLMILVWAWILLEKMV